MDREDDYLDRYNLKSAENRFEFAILYDRKRYILKGSKVSFKDLKKKFRMRFVQRNP